RADTGAADDDELPGLHEHLEVAAHRHEAPEDAADHDYKSNKYAHCRTLCCSVTLFTTGHGLREACSRAVLMQLAAFSFRQAFACSVAPSIPMLGGTRGWYLSALQTHYPRHRHGHFARREAADRQA